MQRLAVLSAVSVREHGGGWKSFGSGVRLWDPHLPRADISVQESKKVSFNDWTKQRRRMKKRKGRKRKKREKKKEK